MCLIETMQQQKQLQKGGNKIYIKSWRLLYFQWPLIGYMGFSYPDRLEKIINSVAEIKIAVYLQQIIEDDL